MVLIGVDLELQRRMAEGIVLPGAPKFNAPDITAPESAALENAAPAIEEAPAGVINVGAPEITEPNVSAPEIELPDGAYNNDAPKFSAPEADAQESDEADFGAPDFDLSDLLVRRSGAKTYTIRAVSRIEDVFTSAERDLLRWLWERGRPIPVTPMIRLVTGPNGEGARRLAVQAGLIYNTFKNLSRALSTKLALDIVKPERNLPAVYAVYHYSAILERQRQAGFTGAIHKNGGGRDLVNAEAQPAGRRPDLTVKELEQILGAQKFGAPNSGGRGPKFGAVSGNFGAPKFSAYIRNKEYTTGKGIPTPSPAAAANSGAPTIVVDALFERAGRTDTDAARMIAKGCVEANPTIQPEEIARLIRTAPIPPNIANPVGLLIRSLPGRCTPESIANYRERWRQEDEQENRRREQERAQAAETARGILEGAAKGEEWDAATVEWAKGILDPGPAR